MSEFANGGAITLNGMILDRAKTKSRESLRFVDIAWAQPYRTKSGVRGTLMLLQSGEFRMYLHSFPEVTIQVARYVYLLTKMGKEATSFPWAT